MFLVVVRTVKIVICFDFFVYNTIFAGFYWRNIAIFRINKVFWLRPTKL